MSSGRRSNMLPAGWPMTLYRPSRLGASPGAVWIGTNYEEITRHTIMGCSGSANERPGAGRCSGSVGAPFRRYESLRTTVRPTHLDKPERRLFCRGVDSIQGGPSSRLSAESQAARLSPVCASAREDHVRHCPARGLFLVRHFIGLTEIPVRRGLYPD